MLINRLVQMLYAKCNGYPLFSNESHHCLCIKIVNNKWLYTITWRCKFPWTSVQKEHSFPKIADRPNILLFASWGKYIVLFLITCRWTWWTFFSFATIYIKDISFPWYGKRGHFTEFGGRKWKTWFHYDRGKRRQYI